MSLNTAFKSIILSSLILSQVNQALAQQPEYQAPAIEPTAAEAPEGAPNVLLVLLDDVGFGAASTFGGPVPTPTYETIAEEGVLFNNFHTTAMCSPTRAALLTGRNHHQVGMGTVMNLAVGEAGYDSIIPDSAATIGQVLKLHGYSTAWFGKNHVTPSWEITPTGPFDRWPTGLGFDYFYGFMDGASDQWNPVLVENTRFIEKSSDPDYILDRGLANRAIDWLRTNNSVSPGRPFFLYLAPGTAHSPHQAPEEWIKKFEGRFDQGWDAMREEIFARQKRLGVIPENTQLTARMDSLPAWDSLSKKEQSVASRLMEVFAAQLAHFDYQFGRIVDELKRSGEWDNTLVVYIDGDNGSSGEGGVMGTTIASLNGIRPDAEAMYDQLNLMGGPETFDNYPSGWAWAMSTPFKWTKQIASHLGGIRNGMAIRWPQQVADTDTIRSQFVHVIDIAPTIYEAVGITPPEQVEGIKQQPLDGISFLDTLKTANAKSKRQSQYFEMLGNRSFYQDGWLASTTPPKGPWERKAIPAAEEYKWELYNLNSDYSQAVNLADQYPEKLKALQAAFERAAIENKVFPLNNSLVGRMSSNLRPYVTNGRDEFEFFRSESWLPDQAFPDLLNKAWDMTAKISLQSKSEAEGTIITQGGNGGGWGLFLVKGKPVFIYNATGVPARIWELSADKRLSAGEHSIQLSMIPDSSTPGSGATVRLRIDNNASQVFHIDATVPFTFPFDGVGIGRDFSTPLTRDYQIPFRFAGTIESVKIQLR